MYCLLDVLKSNSQSYIRFIQRDLVRRAIAVAEYRWHNAVARNKMIQILRHLAISKGCVYVHWDALAAQFPDSSHVKAMARKKSFSHAHGARKCQNYVRDAICKLFEATPNDAKLNFVKEDVFGVPEGGSNI